MQPVNNTRVCKDKSFTTELQESKMQQLRLRTAFKGHRIIGLINIYAVSRIRRGYNA